MRRIMIIRFLLSMSLIYLCRAASTQEIPAESLQYLNRMLEEELIDEEDLPDHEAMHEDLRELLLRPVALNSPDPGIERLLLLTSFQKHMLQSYLEKYNALRSVFELQYVPGFDRQLAAALEPFINLKKHAVPPAIQITGGRSTLLYRIDRRYPLPEGYRKSTGKDSTLRKPHYLGSPVKILTRYDYRSRSFHLGFTGEKDAGEHFFQMENKYGFDFYSLSLQFSNGHSPWNICLGDYHLRTGYGLNVWSSASYGLTGSIRSMSRGSRIMAPYRSANEYRFFRGAAVSYHTTNLRALLFASSKKADGRVESAGGTEYCTSLDETGLHNSMNQLEKEDQLQERLAGGRVILNSGNLRLGATASFYRINPPLAGNVKAYDYSFSGESTHVLSADATYKSNIWEFRSELALQGFKHPAGFASLVLRPHAGHEFYLVWQNAAAGYFTPYGRPPAGGNDLQNTESYTLCWESHPGWGVHLFALAAGKIRKKPEKGKMQQEASWRGQISARKRLNSHWDLLIRLRSSYGSREKISRQAIRIHLGYVPANNWKLGQRLEYSRIPGGYSGAALYQEIQYSLPGIPLLLAGRYALFNCPEYKGRIYAWERDVLYAFRTIAYYGAGYRWYVVARYDAGKHCNVWLKLSQTVQPGAEALGSGQDRVTGPRKTDVRLQCLLRF